MSHIQVEHLGQYWIFLEDMPTTPPKPGYKWNKVPSGYDQVKINKPSSWKTPKETHIVKFGKKFTKTGRKLEGRSQGTDMLDVANLSEEEKKNWGEKAQCFSKAYEWVQKNGGKLYLTEDQSHTIAVNGNVVYDGVKDKEFDKENYLSKTKLKFDELEEKEEESEKEEEPKYTNPQTTKWVDEMTKWHSQTPKDVPVFVYGHHLNENQLIEPTKKYLTSLGIKVVLIPEEFFHIGSEKPEDRKRYDEFLDKLFDGRPVVDLHSHSTFGPGLAVFRRGKNLLAMEVSPGKIGTDQASRLQYLLGMLKKDPSKLGVKGPD